MQPMLRYGSSCEAAVPAQTRKLVDPADINHPLVRALFTFLQRPCEPLLAIGRVNQYYARFMEKALKCTDLAEIFHTALEALEVSYRVWPGDLGRIPKRGPLVVVANHPFGGIEGVVLGAVLLKERPDVKLLANYLLKRVFGIADAIIPVDPFPGPESALANLKGLKSALDWLRSQGALGVFPAGAVASFQFNNRRVADPKWSHHVAALVRRSRATVLPVYFPGRNSLCFQLLGLLHPRLRTAMLGRELVNKCRRPLALYIGRPIPWSVLQKYDSDKTLVDYLRVSTEILRNRRESAVKQVALRLLPKPEPKSVPIATPALAGRLEAELRGLPAEQTLIRSGEYSVHIARHDQIPNILQEIGRLREITFREVHEGTGRAIDLDRFDRTYRHLFLWNHERQELVGAYRLGLTDNILAAQGSRGLYTNQLFRFKPQLLRRLGQSIEFGRSFIRLEYQKKFNSLMLLWKGIGEFIARHPQYRLLFGPVSISKDYHTVSRNLMVRFLKAKKFDPNLSRYVSPRRPYRYRRLLGISRHLLSAAMQDLEDVSLLISGIERDGKGIPILLRQYLKLNGNLICFNVDRAFSDVVDGLLVVNLNTTDPRLLVRFMGPEGYRRFAAYQATEKKTSGATADAALQRKGPGDKKGREAA